MPFFGAYFTHRHLCGSQTSLPPIRVDIRVNIRVHFENGGKKNPENVFFVKQIRPNGVDFLNPEVEKPLTPIFEPNRNKKFFW